jgi:hypothetical protein
MCALGLVWTLGLTGCQPAADAPAAKAPPKQQQLSAANEKLQADVRELQGKLDKTVADAARAEQECAAVREKYQALIAAQERERQAAAEQQKREDQRLRFLNRLSQGQVTNVELEKLFPPKQATREQVQALLGSPDETSYESASYKAWIVPDSIVIGKQYRRVVVRYDSRGTVSSWAFYDR